MARTTGPLFSFDASGSVAGALVFSRWKGRSYVRRHAIPENPKADKQLSVRAMFKFLAQAWAGLTAPNQATWEDPADAQNVSPFNAFMHTNQGRWGNFKGPSNVYPVAELPTGASPPTCAVTGGQGCASVEVTEGATAPDWGVVLFGKLGGAPTGIWSEVLRVEPYITPSIDVLVTPLVPGVWHFKAAGFDLNGFLSVAGADASDTVT